MKIIRSHLTLNYTSLKNNWILLETAGDILKVLPLCKKYQLASKLTYSLLQHGRTIPETWHMTASSWQKLRAALSWTLREKLMHIQWLTLPPLNILWNTTNITIRATNLEVFCRYNIKKKKNCFTQNQHTLFIIFHCPTLGKQSFSLPLSLYLSCLKYR